MNQRTKLRYLPSICIVANSPETSWKKKHWKIVLFPPLAFSVSVMESLITKATTTTNRFPGRISQHHAFSGASSYRWKMRKNSLCRKSFLQKTQKKKKKTSNWRMGGLHLPSAVAFCSLPLCSVEKCIKNVGKCCLHFSTPLFQLCSAASHFPANIRGTLPLSAVCRSVIKCSKIKHKIFKFKLF